MSRIASLRFGSGVPAIRGRKRHYREQTQLACYPVYMRLRTEVRVRPPNLMDLLRTAQSIRIDYRNRLVTIRTPADGSTNSFNGNTVSVLTTLQGQPARLIVDTGVQSLILYKDRLRRHLPQLKLGYPVSQAYAGRLCESAFLTGIRLGAGELQSSVLLLPRAPAPFPAEIDGYIGTNLLHAQVIELNFASETLHWQ